MFSKAALDHDRLLFIIINIKLLLFIVIVIIINIVNLWILFIF